MRTVVSLLLRSLLDVRAGEIIGIAGIDGGTVKQSLFKRLLDYVKLSQVTLLSRVNLLLQDNSSDYRDECWSRSPEDRHRDGMVLEMTVAENIALHLLQGATWKWYLNYNVITQVWELMEEFIVRGAGESWLPAVTLVVTNKAAGRLWNWPWPVFIVSQPTRGLDVGAIEYS